MRIPIYIISLHPPMEDSVEVSEEGVIAARPPEELKCDKFLGHPDHAVRVTTDEDAAYRLTRKHGGFRMDRINVDTETGELSVFPEDAESSRERLELTRIAYGRSEP